MHCEMLITAVTVDSDHATGKGFRETSNNQQYYIPCDKKPRHREKQANERNTLLCKTNMRKEAATVSEKTLVGQLT